MWCELLTIGGIFATEAAGARTYFQGPWAVVEQTFTTARAHAIGHVQGFFFRTQIGLLLGACVYVLTKRRRLVTN